MTNTNIEFKGYEESNCLSPYIIEKLVIAEKQIEEGKTVDAEEVFRELEEKYGF